MSAPSAPSAPTPPPSSSPSADDGSTRWRGVRDPLLVGAAGAAAVTALRFRDPHVEGAWGMCPFLWVTGYPCPFCGGLRAVNNLTHGDLVAALSSNLIAVVAVVVLAVAWVRWFGRRWRGVPQRRMFVIPERAMTWVGAGILVFWLARLTPWGSWLAP